MPLKFMKQLNLNITRRYKAVCWFNSQPIEVEGLINDLKVSLAMNHDISLLMYVVVIDIPDENAVIKETRCHCGWSTSNEHILCHHSII